MVPERAQMSSLSPTALSHPKQSVSESMSEHVQNRETLVDTNSYSTTLTQTLLYISLNGLRVVLIDHSQLLLLETSLPANNLNLEDIRRNSNRGASQSRKITRQRRRPSILVRPARYESNKKGNESCRYQQEGGFATSMKTTHHL